jgi:hypothetical protein
MIKYFAGTIRFGELVLAQASFGFRPQMGPNGMYQIQFIEKVYYGDPDQMEKTIGTHMTVADFQRETFATFEEAREGVITRLRNDIAEKQEEIGNLETEIAILEDVKPD